MSMCQATQEAKRSRKGDAGNKTTPSDPMCISTQTNVNISSMPLTKRLCHLMFKSVHRLFHLHPICAQQDCSAMLPETARLTSRTRTRCQGVEITQSAMQCLVWPTVIGGCGRALKFGSPLTPGTMRDALTQHCGTVDDSLQLLLSWHLHNGSLCLLGHALRGIFVRLCVRAC